MSSDLSKAREVAVEAALAGGSLLKENLEKVKQVTQKTSRRDLVSNIDLEVEKVLLQAIQRTFPSHSILSEEAGVIPNQSEYQWLVDPIDGTMNYVHGHPPFRIALCLLRAGQPVLTVLYGPTRNHLYVAEIGRGAFLNDKAIRVSSNTNLQNSIFMTHLSSKRLPRLRTIVSLEKIYTHTSHIRMFGSGLASMSYIAEGHYDVFFNVETKPWDILPGALLIQEAGGKVTDTQGQPLTLESTSVLATNGYVHDEMLELLKDV